MSAGDIIVLPEEILCCFGAICATSENYVRIGEEQKAFSRVEHHWQLERFEANGVHIRVTRSCRMLEYSRM